VSRSEAIQLVDLLAIIAFVVGLKRLSHPATARSGNTLAAGGMLAAIAATLADEGVVSYWAIAGAIVVGGAIGVVSARAVKMTAMPQMVALFNGVGGGGAGLIALAEYHRLAPEPGRAALEESIAIALSLVIGCISFSGSLIAFAKLQELIGGRPVTYPGHKAVNALIAAAVVILAASISFSDGQTRLVAAGALALLLGVLFVLPIGGADMPVVISLLNSFTGIAAAASGFVLHNDLLIVSGTLVGASGTLLTRKMGQAMNRPLTNVLFGAFGGGGGVAAVAGPGAEGGSVRSLGAGDAAVLLAYASRVVIVPGYGLAVAQAQHVARELGDLLEARRIDVRYAIHPVAGRMPGHMNVLLAEADVPYTQLYEMERINPEFARTDVVLVVGANDVTNPAARTNPESPIYGMPILEVDRAKQVIVLKRSLGTGFAGVDNALYYEPNCSMLFGDAKVSLNALVAAVGAL
jgi:proton-translocating NAD(P)+ transhydrogenase subunit beta